MWDYECNTQTREYLQRLIGQLDTLKNVFSSESNLIGPDDSGFLILTRKILRLKPVIEDVLTTIELIEEVASPGSISRISSSMNSLGAELNNFWAILEELDVLNHGTELLFIKQKKSVEKAIPIIDLLKAGINTLLAQ